MGLSLFLFLFFLTLFLLLLKPRRLHIRRTRARMQHLVLLYDVGMESRPRFDSGAGHVCSFFFVHVGTESRPIRRRRRVVAPGPLQSHCEAESRTSCQRSSPTRKRPRSRTRVAWATGP